MSKTAKLGISNHDYCPRIPGDKSEAERRIKKGEIMLSRQLEELRGIVEQCTTGDDLSGRAVRQIGVRARYIERLRINIDVARRVAGGEA